ncbi:MAG: hypothetical protein MUP22_05950 [Desulfobacterales bacterium]|nr:hypothetical protein [Desulfobacterales bacterium]
MNPKQAINEAPDLEAAVQDYLKTGSLEAKQNVVTVGQAMVYYYAGIYSPGKLDETLRKAANDGFLRALKLYDPVYKVLFTTYATHCIISEIRQELRSRKIFSMPEWLKRLQNDVINATEELAQDNCSLPTLEVIAQKLNVAEKGITEVMQAGSVSMKEIDLKSIKSLRHETFKIPIEDVITLRKSMDRLSNIQKKVLYLISVNLSELSLAIEEEEQALSKTQAQHIQLVENGNSVSAEQEHWNGFKMKYPEDYSENELLRYFEVLSDEFGLRLVDLRNRGKSKQEDKSYISILLEIDLEGRYWGLLQLLDYLRKGERAIRVERVRTARNENVPARININIILNAYFRKDISSDLDNGNFD